MQSTREKHDSDPIMIHNTCILHTCDAPAVTMYVTNHDLQPDCQVCWCAAGHVSIVPGINHPPFEVFDFTNVDDPNYVPEE